MQLVKLKSNLELNVQILNTEANKTVFMIHGMFGNLAQFYLTIAPLVAQKYKVVLFDLKSQGRSMKKEVGYDFNSLAQEVIELADALGYEKFSVLGYSFGCWVAFRCAINFPDRIEKVIAIELPDWPKGRMIERGSYKPEHFMDFVNYLNTDVRDNFYKNKRQLRAAYLMYDYIFNYTTFSEDMNNEKELQREDCERIKAPVLLAFGRKSVCFNELLRIATWIPFADVYAEDGSHDFFLEKTQICSERIVAFLDSSNEFANIYYEPVTAHDQAIS